MAELHVHHPGHQTTHFALGDDQPYKMWTIRCDGLVIYGHDGNRIHIPAQAMLFVEVDLHDSA